MDGSRHVVVGGGKRRALLALLLLHRNEVVSTDRLIDELWDGRPPVTAAKGLQVHISQLRKELTSVNGTTGGGLLTRANGYVLEVASESVDIERFERAIAEAEGANADGRHADAAELLRQALPLWRGAPLADFAYESFAQREIARLEELRLVALEERYEAELVLGHHTKLVADLEALTKAQPLRDRLRGQLMLALYRCGRRGDALEVYRDGHRRSIQELGIEPSAQLRELRDRMLDESPELASPRRAPRETSVVRRSSLALVVAGITFVGVALAVVLRDRGARVPSATRPVLDTAANSVVGIDVSGGLARFALPLSGRPTDIAADDDRLYAVSVDSSALTIADADTRQLARTIPLAMWPAAVAVSSDSVWVADGRRGLLVRMDPGYERITARATWRRPPHREAAGLSRLDSTAVTLAGGAAWVTDGSSRIVRVDERGRLSRVRSPHPLDGVAAGAGAVWAISRRDAAVIRVDPGEARVTDDIRIVARPGTEAPAPIAIAATRSAVWVLNGNTATVSRIDARTRGVTTTIPLSVEQSPRDIDAGAGAIWVANFDGSLTRISEPGDKSRSSFLGASLVGVAGSAKRVWVAVTALDQNLPGDL
jgi:DNA-binding SARP family transcriptional activator/DNA-binding beta-propeller fold protein YncE